MGSDRYTGRVLAYRRRGIGRNRGGRDRETRAQRGPVPSAGRGDPWCVLFGPGGHAGGCAGRSRRLRRGRETRAERRGMHHVLGSRVRGNDGEGEFPFSRE